MTTQLTIAGLLATITFCLLAIDVTPKKDSELRKIEPKPITVIIPCEERAIICRARSRLEKVRKAI